MAGLLTSITVSVDVKIAADQATPYFIYGLGNTGANGTGNGYLFTTGNAYRTSIATGNWSTEQTVTAGRNLARGVWKTVTYTLAGGTAVLYEDGVEVARNTGVTITPGADRRRHDDRQLPRPVASTAATATSRAQVRDFRIYDRALTAAEVAELGRVPATTQRVAADAAALDLGDTSARHRRPHAADHRPERLHDHLGVQRPGRRLDDRRRHPARPRQPATRRHPDRDPHPRRRERRPGRSPSPCPADVSDDGEGQPAAAPRPGRATPTTSAATSRCRPRACTARRSPGRPAEPARDHADRRGRPAGARREAVRRSS